MDEVVNPVKRAKQLLNFQPRRSGASIFGVVCLSIAFAASGARGEGVPAPEWVPPVPHIGSVDYEQGGYVYERNCVICHGPQGDGRGEFAASLPVKPRSFRTGMFKYRSTPWGKLPTSQDLQHTVRNGITGTAMGMFTQLSDSEIKSVVEYIKIFSRKWRKPENYAAPLVFPPAPKWLGDDAECARHAENGKPTFQLVCAVCHGTRGDGNGPAAAGLKDIVGELSPPADLRQPHLRSGDAPEDIYRVLMTGLNGTPMVSFADTFTSDQKWDLVACILQWRRDFSATQRDQAAKP